MAKLGFTFVLTSLVIMAVQNVRIDSYNSTGSGPGRREFIQDLLSNTGILLVQEHWLLEEQFSKYQNDIGKGVMVHGVSGMDSATFLQGRPYGGCAIVWKMNDGVRVSPVHCPSRRVCAVRLKYDDLDDDILVVNAYMPPDTTGEENLREFTETLREISSLLEVCNTNYIIVGGDFNTDFSRERSPHTRVLKDFIERETLFCGLQLPFAQVDYTYECMISGSRSTLDHFLVSENLIELTNQYKVFHSAVNPSGHSVLQMSLDVPVVRDDISSEQVHRNQISWDRLSHEEHINYKRILEQNLEAIEIPIDTLLCQNFMCRDHAVKIEKFHDDIIRACIVSGELTLPVNGASHNIGHNGLAGWNEEVSQVRSTAIFWHNLWKDNGSPRSGIIADIRRKTRARYHYAVRRAKSDRDRISATKLAEKMESKSSKDFWKEVKKIKGKSSALPNAIDNVSGKEDIGNLFKGKFERLYNSVSYEQTEMDEVKTHMNGLIETCCARGICSAEHHVTVNDVLYGISCLKRDKKDSITSLNTNHFCLAGNKLAVYVSMLLRTMLTHGYCPGDFRLTTVVPIPKNPRKSLYSSDNYRGIALSSIIGKIFDYIILKNHGDTLSTSDAQFGFKKGSSTLHWCDAGCI